MTELSSLFENKVLPLLGSSCHVFFFASLNPKQLVPLTCGECSLMLPFLFLHSLFPKQYFTGGVSTPVCLREFFTGAPSFLPEP